MFFGRKKKLARFEIELSEKSCMNTITNQYHLGPLKLNEQNLIKNIN